MLWGPIAKGQEFDMKNETGLIEPIIVQIYVESLNGAVEQ